MFGSTAAEIVAALNSTLRNDGKCPEIYKRPFYLVVRLAVAVIPAGGLPVLLEATNPLTAFYLGLSAPLFLDRMQRTISESGENK